MITAIRSCARQGHMLLRSWWHKPIVYRIWRISQCLFTGFFLSAASLGHHMQPLVMGAVCAGGMQSGLLTALGGILGYRIFWGEAGLQGVVWTVLGFLLSLLWLRVLGIPKQLATILNDFVSFPVSFLLNKFWAFSPGTSKKP